MISTVSNRVPLAAAPGKLRLVNPGRLLRLPLILLLALAFAIGNISVSNAGSDAVDVQLTYISVQGGDSLWSLAERYAADADPQEWMYELIRLNALTSAELQPGQRLALPN
jgi:LysM repeat protein